MDSALNVAWCWLLFAGTHIGLATAGVRPRLVARLGAKGFRALFFLVAAVTYTLLVRSYALHQHEGALGLGGAVGPALRWVLFGIAGLGAILMVAGLIAYPASPMELAATRVPSPTRLAQITRHPFFVGLAMIAATHAVLATHATGTVFFTGLAAYPLAGAWHQDQKLLTTKGEPYAAYCRVTSIVPFAAIVTGRTNLSLRDLPIGPILIGCAGAVGLRAAHPNIMAWDGLAVIIAVVGGGTFFGIMGMVRLARRRRAAVA